MDDGPYRGYHADDFNTVKLDAPIRGPSPATSTFDRAPVRGTAPPTSSYTSDFNEGPVRPMYMDSQQSATGEFEPPVRVSPKSSTTPMVGSMLGSQKVNGGGGGGYGSWAGLSKQWLLTDVILRVLTLLCVVVAVALLPGFISKMQDLREALAYTYALAISTASPKYEIAVAAVGILYAGFGTVIASIRYFGGQLVLGDITHLIFYIGDQGLSFAITTVKYMMKNQNFSTNNSLKKRRWLGLDSLLLALICFCSIVLVTRMRDNLIIHSLANLGDHVHEQRRQDKEDDEVEEAGQSRDISGSAFQQGLEWASMAMVVFMQLGIVLTFIRRPSIGGI
ncbi:hypothetical protein L7F22_010360 [Adiantum nelumboides]|nr:hypothetical protein [Adiantum nelumboides]